MTKKNSLKAAPYNGIGLMHYAAPESSYLWAGSNRPEWRPNTPMELTLTMNGVVSGRSAKYVKWTGADGTIYPMFVSDLVEMFHDGVNVTAGRVQGVFKVRKRGQNYGLCYEGPIPVEVVLV